MPTRAQKEAARRKEIEDLQRAQYADSAAHETQAQEWLRSPETVAKYTENGVFNMEKAMQDPAFTGPMQRRAETQEESQDFIKKTNSPGGYEDLLAQRDSTSERARLDAAIAEGRSTAGKSRASLYAELNKEDAYWKNFRKKGGPSVAEAMLNRQGTLAAKDQLGAAAAMGGRGGSQQRALREAQMGGERTMESAFAQGAIARIQEQKEKESLAGQMLASIAGQRTSAEQLYQQALLGYTQIGAGVYQSGVADATQRYGIDTNKAIADAQMAFQQQQAANAEKWRWIGLGANVLGTVGGAIATGGASVPVSAAQAALKSSSEAGKQADYSAMPAPLAYDKNPYTPTTPTAPKSSSQQAGFTYGQPRGADSSSGLTEDWDP
jgi:hypothetical protein